MMLRLAIAALVLMPATTEAQLVSQSSGTDAEFRAMDAPSADVVWAAGRGGVYAVTSDGGATWRADSVPGASGLFFTGVWAADARRAYLLGTSFDGGLARVYRTDDGGATWATQWESSEEGVFMDALQCWDVEHCVAYGDPIGGTLYVIRTQDGRTWGRMSVPELLTGEAGFAASGTTLTLYGNGLGWIGTGGGSHARVYMTHDAGASWSVADTPLPGNSTSGIFGIAFRDPAHGVAVGGNYEQRATEQRNVMRTSDGGRTWQVVGMSVPHGVRYGVAYSPQGALVAVGPSGVGASWDHGATWTALDGTFYNTVTFAPNGDAWVGGPDGRVAKIPRDRLSRVVK